MLAAREALAAEPGAGAAATADVGRSLTRRRRAARRRRGRRTRRWRTYRRGRVAAGRPGARPTPEARSELADCRSRLAFSCRRSARTRRRWRRTGWRGADQEALAARPGRRERGPARPGGHDQPASAISCCQTGRPSGGGGRVPQALAIREKLAADNPAVTEFRSDLADSHNNLGILLSETGRPTEAEAEHREALAIQEKLAADNPAVTDSAATWRSATSTSASCCRRLASRRRRRPSTARRWRSERSWPPRTPPSPNSAATWRTATTDLGFLLFATGRPTEAEAEYRQALAIREKLAAENPAVTEFRSALADCHNNLGCLLSQTGKPAEAEAEYREALAIQEKLAEDDRNPASPNAIGVSLTSLGDVDTEAGRFDPAIARCRESLAIHERLAHDNPTPPPTEGNWPPPCPVWARRDRAGRRAAAVEPLKRAATLWEAIAEPDIEARYELARDYTLLAAAAADSGPVSRPPTPRPRPTGRGRPAPGRRDGLPRPGRFAPTPPWTRSATGPTSAC